MQWCELKVKKVQNRNHDILLKNLHNRWLFDTQQQQIEKKLERLIIECVPIWNTLPLPFFFTIRHWNRNASLGNTYRRLVSFSFLSFFGSILFANLMKENRKKQHSQTNELWIAIYLCIDKSISSPKQLLKIWLLRYHTRIVAST